MSDQAFDELLREATEALASNLPDKAEEAALSALRQEPGNPLAQNLVGLSYFGQGRHDQALEVFDSLARRNADVVALRINAGVAALRAGDRSRAETHLRRAIDLDPGQRRAFAYLALVHLEKGQLKLARAAMVEAGLTELAERSDDETDIGGEALAKKLATATRRIPSAKPPVMPWRGYTEVDTLGGGAEADDVEEGDDPAGDLDESFDNLDAAFAQLDSAPRRPSGEQPSATEDASEADAEAAEPAQQTAEAQGELGEEPRAPRGTEQRLLALKPPRSAFCFAVFPKLPMGAEDGVELHNAAEEDDARCLVLGPRALEAGVCVRSDLAKMRHGHLERAAVATRDKGTRGAPMQIRGVPLEHIAGRGTAVLVNEPNECFEIVRLADEACCVAESAVAAFSEGLRWERGQIPGTTIGALELVGRGFVAISCRAPLERLRLKPEQPLQIRPDCLIGWAGSVVPIVSNEPAEQPMLECTGQGMVVLCLTGGVLTEGAAQPEATH